MLGAGGERWDALKDFEKEINMIYLNFKYSTSPWATKSGLLLPLMCSPARVFLCQDTQHLGLSSTIKVKEASSGAGLPEFNSGSIPFCIIVDK